MVRFIAGGLVVMAFSAVAEVLRPKSLAGLFGAAPSVALVTLSLGFLHHGPTFVAKEASTMALGAVAMLAYAMASLWLVRTERVPAWLGTLGSLAAWFLTAFGLKGAS